MYSSIGLSSGRYTPYLPDRRGTVPGIMAAVDDHFEIDWTEAADRLATAARTDADWYRSVAALVVRPDDGVAVDVGCGGGGMAVVLAAALGAGARVIGVDGA